MRKDNLSPDSLIFLRKKIESYYIREMKIQLICIGKTNIDYLKVGIQEYTKRLGHYIPFEIIEIPYPKSIKKSDELGIKKIESDLFFKQIDSSTFMILLDERGKEFHSINFSKYIQKRMNSGHKKIAFIIGGAYGFSDEIYQRANDKISLSQMTFSHQMVRLFAVEQIYRAFTIIKGDPYHHS